MTSRGASRRGGRWEDLETGADEVKDDDVDGSGRPTRPTPLKRSRGFGGHTKRTSIAVPRMPTVEFLKLLHKPKARCRLSDDEFEALYGYGYDACFCFKHDPKRGRKLSAGAREIVKRLHRGGIETKVVVASEAASRRLIWVMLRVPTHRLAHAADTLDWVVPLNPGPQKGALMFLPTPTPYVFERSHRYQEKRIHPSRDLEER